MASRMNRPSRSKAPVSMISAGSSRKASMASRPSCSSWSRSKPSEATLVARSSWASSKASRTPGSPKSRAPRTRNSIPNRVLPEPAAPVTRVGRPRGQAAARDLVEAVDAGGRLLQAQPSAGTSLGSLELAGHDVLPVVPVCSLSRGSRNLARVRPRRSVAGCGTRGHEEEAPDETPALAFPLRTQKRLIEGPFWAVTLMSGGTWVNAWSRPDRARVRTGYPPAVENPVDRVWRTGRVLWITARLPPQWAGDPTSRPTRWPGRPLRRGTGGGPAPDRVPARAQPRRDLQGQGVPVRGRDDPARWATRSPSGCGQGTLRELPGIGASTAEVIEAAVEGRMPARLAKLEREVGGPLVQGGEEVRARLRGDLHSHSDWSDGGSPIEEMAFTAIELGHDYLVLTDHSPRLTVANGLSVARLTRSSVSSRPSTSTSAVTAASGCSRASRSTSSTTARSTRPTRCWRGSTYASRRCTPSWPWTRQR